ncbi:MAG: hypothetical protein VB111_07990 [Clostridiaceae bacterium]|nr:hypothetical protein [Clostridiaceae bacterium]
MIRLLPWLCVLCLLLAACTRVETGKTTATAIHTTSAQTAAATSIQTTTAKISTQMVTTAAATTAVQTTQTAATTTATTQALYGYPENMTYTILADAGAPELCMGMIIKNPSREQLSEAVLLQRYIVDEDGETLLVIPRFDSMKMSVCQAIENEDGTVSAGDELYIIRYTEDGTALALRAQRTEGKTKIVVVVSGGGCEAEYPVTYGGRGGRAENMFLLPIDG